MNLSLCPYKNSLGKVKKGLHSYRLFDIAMFDVIGTIGISFMISKYYDLDFIEVMTIAFLLGIILHHLFCVRTTVDKILFLKK